MDHSSMETYFGLIKTPHDALIIFEGKSRHLPSHQKNHKTKFTHKRGDRPSSRKSIFHASKLASGSVYCFDEREAGMRRWTDGKSWSPSRVTGTFLTYRELDDSQGSHTNKNVYRPNGLLKQSFSITTSDNQKLHLISYYTSEDVASERLCNTPSLDPRFAEIVLPKGIYPEMAVPVAEPASVNQTSPSPPMPNRKQRPHHRAFQQQGEEDPSSLRVDARPGTLPHQQHRRNGSSSSSHSASGHRRTNSGSSSLKEHRYSPIQVPEGKYNASRSRSNSNLAVYSSSAPKGNMYTEREQRYKSSSPSTTPLFPATPSNAYSPAASWASDDDQPMIVESGVAQESVPVVSHAASVMIPALRELPPLHRGYESKLKDRLAQPHEQDSLSVLANLATHSLLLPKLEPKEVSVEKSRWVEDDRQLRALSTMLRL
ncbi:hypothetical protein BGZ67_008133 [Mortierella alpina]|nr:hypothetical protein BGZ67_008133 [Mortierella alpina]